MRIEKVVLHCLAQVHTLNFQRFGLLEDAPDYLNKGMEIFAKLKKVGEGFIEDAERRSVNAGRDLQAQFGD